MKNDICWWKGHGPNNRLEALPAIWHWRSLIGLGLLFEKPSSRFSASDCQAKLSDAVTQKRPLCRQRHTLRLLLLPLLYSFLLSAKTGWVWKHFESLVPILWIWGDKCQSKVSGWREHWEFSCFIPSLAITSQLTW